MSGCLLKMASGISPDMNFDFLEIRIHCFGIVCTRVCTKIGYRTTKIFLKNLPYFSTYPGGYIPKIILVFKEKSQHDNEMQIFCQIVQ